MEIMLVFINDTKYCCFIRDGGDNQDNVAKT